MTSKILELTVYEVNSMKGLQKLFENFKDNKIAKDSDSKLFIKFFKQNKEKLYFTTLNGMWQIIDPNNTPYKLNIQKID